MNAFEHGIVHAHVMSLGADRVLALGIENYEVGVAADRDRSLTRIQTEELGRSRGNQFDESIHAETSLSDAAGVNQAHAMFNAWATVWNFGEIAASKFLLFFKAKGTMVCRDDLQVIPLEAVPELFLMPFFS